MSDKNSYFSCLFLRDALNVQFENLPDECKRILTLHTENNNENCVSTPKKRKPNNEELFKRKYTGLGRNNLKSDR